MVEFTEQNWEAEVLGSNQPVLVDFWAPWCAPCRQIAPTIEAMAGDYSGRMKVGKLNVDDHSSVAARWRRSGSPDRKRHRADPFAAITLALDRSCHGHSDRCSFFRSRCRMRPTRSSTS